MDVDLGNLVLPCEPEENFTRILNRAERYNLPLSRIGENPTIALLLTNHQIHKEALPCLYENVCLKVRSTQLLAKLPETLKQNITHIDFDSEEEMLNLIGCRPGFRSHCTRVGDPSIKNDQARHRKSTELGGRWPFMMGNSHN